MFSNTTSAYSDYKNLKLTAFSVSLHTRAPLEKSAFSEGLSAIQKRFPQLRESNYNDKKDTFKIENGETEVEDQMLLRLGVEKCTGFVFSWGVNAPFGARDEILGLFDAFQQSTSLLPVNVEYIDVRLHAASHWEGNHYAVIWDAFFSNTSLFGIFDPETILQDDLILRAMLGKDRICLVEIGSNVKDAEIRKKEFENDMLRVHLSLADVRYFAPDDSLAELAVKHVEFATDFALKHFLPSVVAPLNEALGRVSEEGNEQ